LARGSKLVAMFAVADSVKPGAREVILELQRRGLFRTEYEGSTLRDHLGLPKPVSIYASGGQSHKSGAA